MNTLSFTERASQLKEQEQAIQYQLDRMYALVEEGKAESIIQLEYKRYVERLAEKYQLLFLGLETDKEGMETSAYDKQAADLKAQYAQDIVTAAAAIDAAIEERGSGQQPQEQELANQ